MDNENSISTPQENPLEQDQLKIPVDPEPITLRLALVGIMILGFAFGYWLVTITVAASACSVLGVFGGILLGVALLQIAERTIKPRWRSGRFVYLSEDSLSVLAGENARQEIDPTQQVNVYMWRFEVQSRSRVPKGWYVVATALEQDDIYLPVYTLTPPENFEGLELAGHFTQLTASRGQQARQDGSDLRLAGQQRRLLTAEQAREIEGVEMHFEDFEVYLTWLQNRFPAWMPTN